MSSDEASPQEIGAEVAAIGEAFGGFVRRRLILWAVRWTIGFALIAWATRTWVGLDWLWWAGGVVAGLSLVALLTTGFLVQRKVQGIQGELGDASEEAAR